MRVILVNKRFPPNRSATGYHGYGLAQYLHSVGHTIHLISTHGSQSSQEPIDGIFHHRIKSLYDGKSIMLRLIFTLIDSYRLIRRAKKTKGTRYIIMSDPPFLQFIATFLLPSERTIFWMMDLYPEAFIAKGLIRRETSLIRWYKNRLQKFNPLVVLALGDHQKKYITSEYAYRSTVSIPVGLQDSNLSDHIDRPRWYTDQSKIYFGYFGNLGEAHDVLFLEQFITQLDSKKHHMILSCQGSKAQRLLQYCGHLNTVSIVEQQELDQIAFIDVHIVTLINSWTHTCVPSKALLALQVGGAVLFNGSEKSDTWQYVKSAGWRIESNERTEKSIRHFLEVLERTQLTKRKKIAQTIAQELKEQLSNAYNTIAQDIDDKK